VTFPDSPAASFESGDLRDEGLIPRILREHEVTRVLHLAALVGARAEDDPVAAVEVNAMATARLLRDARAAGVHRVVAMSTKGVLGPLPERYLHPTYQPVPVDHPPNPRTIYETTKLVVERLVAASRAGGLEACAMRLATTWGPGKTGTTHEGFSLHSDIASAAARGESVELDVHPDQGFDLVYYADVAAGLAAAALDAIELRSTVYHLGSGRLTTMSAFAHDVQSAFPGVTVRLGDRFPPGRNCLLDIGEAQRDLDYRPAWDIGRALGDIRRSSSATVRPAATSRSGAPAV
jgi:UDP-glucose 4-epimerase